MEASAAAIPPPADPHVEHKARKRWRFVHPVGTLSAPLAPCTQEVTGSIPVGSIAQVAGNDVFFLAHGATMGVVLISDITPGHHLANVDVVTTVRTQEVVGALTFGPHVRLPD
jgi:hypothetical protein